MAIEPMLPVVNDAAENWVRRRIDEHGATPELISDAAFFVMEGMVGPFATAEGAAVFARWVATHVAE